MNTTVMVHNQSVNSLKIQDAIAQIKHNLAEYNNRSITLIAVSKYYSITNIQEAYNYGINNFAENDSKILALRKNLLKELTISWHFIGNIQSNKTAYIAKHADVVHSLCKSKHAIRLNQQRPDEAASLKVLIQANISNDFKKLGLTNFEQVLNLARIILQLPKLELIGLMGIAVHDADNHIIGSQFNFLKEYLVGLNHELGLNLQELSMGMSNDYRVALASGATMLRIGNLIFGDNSHT